MNVTGNTLLIAGGTSGIGRALAERFRALGNRVIFSGRRQALRHPLRQTAVLRANGNRGQGS